MVGVEVSITVLRHVDNIFDPYATNVGIVESRLDGQHVARFESPVSLTRRDDSRRLKADGAASRVEERFVDVVSPYGLEVTVEKRGVRRWV